MMVTAERPPVPPRSFGQRALGLALLALLGAVHTIAYSHTALWPLAFVAMVVLPGVLARYPPSWAACLAGAFGVGWLGAGVWWLFVSMHRYGGLPAPLAAMAVASLALVLSLYLAGTGAAWSWLVRAKGAQARHWPARVGLAAAWAGHWLAAELARAQWFTGFPWVASGYAFIDSPWVAWAPWLGVYGVGALVAGVACLWALVIAPPGLPGSTGPKGRRPAWQPAAVCMLITLGLIAAPSLGPASFSVSSGSIRVSLLQTNVSQDEKFAADRLVDHLAQLKQDLLAAQASLVVAPETAVPLLPYQLEAVDPGWWAAVAAHFQNAGRVALVGVPLGDEQRYTNSAVSVGAAAAYRYDKHHLVPFGEFIPWGFRWFTEALQIPLGDFARGPVDAASLVVGVQRIGPNICYEDLFGEELAVRLTRGDDAPTVWVNLSNIGWFGDTVALPQHLNISRFRSLEFERPMLRSTNTGVTAIIDHRGRVQAQLPPLTRGTLEGQVDGRRGLTPYARWVGRWGLWPLWGAAVLLVGLGWRLRRP